MSRMTERTWGRRRVSFTAGVSNEIDVRGYAEFFLEIQGALSGATINIESQKEDETWAQVLDSAGAVIAVPSTTDGLVLLPPLPTFGKIRFTAGAVNVETHLDCKS